MATITKHSTRLLSPSESLLCALLPSVTSASVRPAIFHQRRPQSIKARAQALPADFDINKLLKAQRLPKEQQELNKLSAYTLDEAIDSRWVQTKDSATAKLGPPQLLDALLNSVDRSTHSVLQLSAVGPTPGTAVVDVISRSDLLQQVAQRERSAREQQKQKRTTKMKQIELNWAISENDLGLKLKQMEKFLDKGSRVELLLANKKRQRKAELNEAQATLDKVRATIEGIEGVGERSMEGRVGAQATLIVEPR